MEAAAAIVTQRLQGSEAEHFSRQHLSNLMCVASFRPLFMLMYLLLLKLIRLDLAFVPKNWRCKSSRRLMPTNHVSKLEYSYIAVLVHMCWSRN